MSSSFWSASAPVRSWSSTTGQRGSSYTWAVERAAGFPATIVVPSGAGRSASRSADA
ncbi:hypothetical protein [Streptomyces globisporus]|uniref:hypothetical protein n=1 Tax=Streptomyces globisporus TaxID=1908 RepID=UPI00131E18CC|nr:hypothetical protein [Streptomyces globisporus]